MNKQQWWVLGVGSAVVVAVLLYAYIDYRREENARVEWEAARMEQLRVEASQREEQKKIEEQERLREEERIRAFQKKYPGQGDGRPWLHDGRQAAESRYTLKYNECVRQRTAAGLDTAPFATWAKE